ncbi:MAG: hypothetical protein FJZ79_01665 [Chlorobi bacterium]|nr:hypothetical protein [Chlorobiota bacterium]
MQQVVEFLSAHPILLVLGVAIAVVILFGFFRKVMQFVLVVAAAFVLYVAWLQFSGDNAPETFRQIQEVVNRSMSRLGAMLKPLFELLKIAGREAS